MNFFKEHVLDNDYDENMFNSDGTFNPNYNSFKKTGLIAEIFEDHWDDTYLKNKEIIDKYRPNATKEIEKVINCQPPRSKTTWLGMVLEVHLVSKLTPVL